MPSKPPQIGVLAANAAEFEALSEGLAMLNAVNCPYDYLTQSVWTGLDQVTGWARKLEQEGASALIVAAGAEPQAAGIVAAASRLPVIAVPLYSPGSRGGTSRAALATSHAAPVLTVRSGGAGHAAMAALRILAASEKSWLPALIRLKGAESAASAQLAGSGSSAEPAGGSVSTGAPKGGSAAAPRKAELPTHVISADTQTFSKESMSRAGSGREDRALDEDNRPVEIRTVDFSRPLSGKVVGPTHIPAVTGTSEEDETLPPPPARHLGRCPINVDAPEVDLIEDAVDCLLEGGIVAFPTETVYGLAVDATNPAAVERLFELKGRPRTRAISLMVDQPRLLAAIAQNLTVEVRRLMEAYWPGPLTLILQKRPGNFEHVSDGETIGVRLPDHPVPLALIQALARPLACTSANFSGEPDALSADEIENDFGDGVNVILDGGVIPDRPPSTVLDVTAEPFRILRKGALGYDQLLTILGEKLEVEG